MNQSMASAMEYKQIAVLDSHMTYRETGSGKPLNILFLHGNPTSSYIWRNITPHLADQARCIAPDLIGFGRSGKPDIDYRFVDQVRYLDAFIAALDLQEYVLVAQDWGTALAFHLAQRRPQAVLGLGFMEFIRPLASFEDFHPSPATRALFQKFRTPGEGEQLILEQNVFIEKVLPASIVRTLSEEEMEAYRAPFPTPQSRKPTWRFPNELPIAGTPADVCEIVETFHQALLDSDYPKVLFGGDPGVLTPPALARSYAEQLKNCRLVELGTGRHYLQEDHADRIGQELAVWLQESVLCAAE